MLKIYSKSIFIETQSKNWGGGSQLSMEGVDLDYSKNDNFILEVNS